MRVLDTRDIIRAAVLQLLNHARASGST